MQSRKKFFQNGNDSSKGQHLFLDENELLRVIVRLRHASKQWTQKHFMILDRVAQLLVHSNHRNNSQDMGTGFVHLSKRIINKFS